MRNTAGFLREEKRGISTSNLESEGKLDRETFQRSKSKAKTNGLL